MSKLQLEEIYKQVADGTLSKEEAIKLIFDLTSQGDHKSVTTETIVLTNHVNDNQQQKIEQFNAKNPSSEVHTQAITSSNIDKKNESSENLVNAILDYIVGKITPLFPIDMTYDLDANMMDIGVDSINLIKITRNIEQEAKIELYPTLFFEYTTIRELSNYFAKEHPTAFLTLLNQNDSKETSGEKNLEINTIPTEKIKEYKEINETKESSDITYDDSAQSYNDNDIAIIGMAGVFSESPNLEKFWENLYNKRNLITEIPSDHWDYRPWFDSRPQTKNKLYCKWGSFIQDVDKFDADFFNISPLEAEAMDPQLRWLLQVLYATAEDAGYADKLKTSNTGIYTGVCFHDYSQELCERNKPIEPHDSTGNAMPMLANRPSFFFDLRGPSLTVDTACSSSLFALHLACQALKNKECNMAFVAGVNLLLSSAHYRHFCSLGALSPTGQCYSFDSRADGYVPGEGIASILLKPLKKAIEDGDQIHAVIKGSAVNHGGYTPSVTAPSIKQEAEVILQAWKNASIDPSTISFIEAHGTGTKLGDPIEVKALKNAFANFTDKTHACAIGSAKAYIGHTEGAAGIAGIIKVILSMKHKEIPAMPNFKELNPILDFKDSPLYINTEVQKWETSKNIPRRAGVSSFGFGGAYAHVVIEESPLKYELQQSIKPFYLIALSAKTSEVLHNRISELHQWLERNGKNYSLKDISYSLNVGHSHFEKRCIFIVNSIQELKDNLQSVMNAQIPSNYISNFSVKKTKLNQDDKKQITPILEKIEHYQSLSKEEYYNQLLHLGEFYIKGHKINWKILYEGESRQMISLPTYPFVKERYWSSILDVPITSSEEKVIPYKLHPLLDNKTSTTDQISFSKLFNKNEFFLRDHKVNSIPFLPGVVYLEMVRAATILAFDNNSDIKDNSSITLKNITWVMPIQVEDSQLAHINLYPKGDDLTFEVYTLKTTSQASSGNNKVIHAQGKTRLNAKAVNKKIDFSKITGAHSIHLKGTEIYGQMSHQALELGPSFHVIQDFYINQQEALVKLSLPSSLRPYAQEFFLHPCILDGAFQSAGMLFDILTKNQVTILPFNIKTMNVYSALPINCYVYISLSNGSEKTEMPIFQIQLTNEKGDVLVEIEDFSMRLFQNKITEKEKHHEVFYYHPIWEENQLIGKSEIINPISMIIFTEDDTFIKYIRDQFQGNDYVWVHHDVQYKKISDIEYTINTDNEEDYNTLLSELTGINAKRIIYKTSIHDNSSFKEKIISDNVAQTFYKLLFLSKALLKHKYKEPIELICINQGLSVFAEAISGLIKTLNKENPKITYRNIELREMQPLAKELNSIDREVKYDESHTRRVKYYIENSLGNTDQKLIKKNGIYIISGGAGKLGLILCKYLAQFQANIILLGRSDLNHEKQATIAQLEKTGAQITYIKTDIAVKENLKSVIKSIKTRFEHINGIIHSAGNIKDSLILKKNKDECKQILDAKIQGAIFLDELTKNEELDFFVLFSSTSGVFGNFGQCDYAYANAFLDAFSGWRENLRSKNERHGKTISIDWPLWADGGMTIDVESQKWLNQMFGIIPLSSIDGYEAFHDSLGQKLQQQIVLSGQKDKIVKLFGSTLKSTSVMTLIEKTPIKPQGHQLVSKEKISERSLDNNNLTEKTINHLVNTIAAILKYNTEKIDIEKDYSEIGLDSTIALTFSNQINSFFDIELTPPVFFEYTTIKKLAEYLVNEHPDNLQAKFGELTSDKIPVYTNFQDNLFQGNDKALLEKTINHLVRTIATIMKSNPDKIDIEKDYSELGLDSNIALNFSNEINLFFDIELTPAAFFEYTNIKKLAEYMVNEHGNNIKAKFGDSTKEMKPSTDKYIETTTISHTKAQPTRTFYSEKKLTQSHDIAIIGMEARFPGSPNLKTFWTNLRDSKELITEIPADRWNWKDYYGDSDAQTKVKWGGFIEGIDQFDAKFFNITPAEAELMDPQQRILLEACWNLIENAGYKVDDLPANKTGVFIGIAMSDYSQILQAANISSPHVPTGVSHAVLVNRVSYALNLQGPSEAIDTACSSSLVAIHNAIQAIQSGDCEVAIAGGVNAMLTPALFIAFTQAGMLAPDGQCKTFDKTANGYVRGEGIGVVLLKSLDKAITDGDHIYGVIKGSAVNHGGHVSALTVPNPNAQADVIITACERANIGIDTLTYIEAHGTGTSLGDPIEVNGLKKAFRTLKQKQGKPDKLAYCGIGSVKSNIGHLEGAAGISGILKILLSLQYKQLPATQHFKELNPYIKLDKTPFYIVTETCEWKHQMNEDGEIIPLRAGVSSFGYGGANAHIIIEEAPLLASPERITKPFYIITLSAKTEEALKQRIINLKTWLTEQKNENIEPSLADISYTLNIGRVAFDNRCALVVNSIDDLIESLQSLIEGRSSTQSFISKLDTKPNDQAIFKKLFKQITQELTNRVSEEEYKDNLLALANFYAEGHDIDWHILYADEVNKRVPLPTYPFAKKRYWVSPPSSPSLKDKKESLATITASTTLTAQSTNQIYAIYKKTWQPMQLQSTSKPSISGPIFVLINNHTIELAKTCLHALPNTQAIFIQNGNESKTMNDHHYIFSFDDDKASKTLAEELIRKYPDSIAVIDFSDLKAEFTGKSWGKLGFLQSILKDKTNKDFYLLHFTQNLQDFESKEISLSGAEFASLIPVLNAEYRKLIAKTIDVDNVDAIQAIMANELTSVDHMAEIVYRHSNRYIPNLQALFEQRLQTTSVQPSISIHPEKVYIITGGTRGIGRELAKHLVERGATKLVLMGMQDLPPRSEWKTQTAIHLKDKIEAITKLEALGAKIEIYSGQLNDVNKLSSFFADIRNTLGKIGGVIHCAGLLINENPAFISKEMKEIEAVCEPKISGLLTLHEIFKQDQLDFFILFSSISSYLPALGIGVSDYAMANGFMNYFASYQASRGHNYYNSIVWPSWKEVGMGEAKNQAYHQLGLASLSNNQGIYLFDKVMTYPDQHCLLPMVVNLNLFKIDSLFKKPLELKAAVKPITASHVTTLNTDWLTQLFSEKLKIPIDELDPNLPFGDFGVDSILLADLVKKIEKKLNINFDPSQILEHPTLNTLSQYISQHHPGAVPEQDSITTSQELPIEDRSKHISTVTLPSSKQKIAVIGMACHFPKAPDKEKFWDNLINGKSGITEVPASRWNIEELYASNYQPGKSTSKWGGFINDIENFDAGYFSISEEDAAHIDPLERQFLEITVQTLADAGYDKKELWNKKVGVFVGSRVSTYGERIQALRKNTIVGVGQNFIAAHVSHLFNFKGPSLVVDSACSSSLVSLNLACQSLELGECDIALAGGVDILLDEKAYLLLSEAQALSPDGKCHTFDEKANGFVPGEGCGAVLLKPLHRALADGDRIYAVIDAIAVNNDGHTMGVTTPNPKAQQEVIEEALAKSEINPATISYVETHGTGTMIGDPIELRALTSVFSKRTDKTGFCAVGSVKTNIGHTLSAAGIASFIKVVLSLYNKKIVPTLNCEQPNPRFDFLHSPFYPNTKLIDWLPVENIRRAGISSFGFGGTNVHCIISEYNQDPATIIRTPLSPVVFNRKRYWLEKSTSSQAFMPSLDLANDHFSQYLKKSEIYSDNNKKSFTTVLYFDNFIVRDHRVHEMRTLPGVAFIDMIYRFLENDFPTQKIVIKNLLFKEPIVVTYEFDRRIYFRLIKENDHWNVSIQSQKIKNNVALDDQKIDNAACNLYLEPINLPNEQIDINHLKLTAKKISDMDVIYAPARKVDIVHYEFMKALGKVYHYPDHILMEIRLGNLAKQFNNQLYIHPAFLDAATFTVGASMLDHTQDVEATKPYIPIFIKEFRMQSRMHENYCYVYAPKQAVIQGSGDVIKISLKAYDGQGNLIFIIDELTTKCIRSKNLIQQLGVAHATDINITESLAASIVNTNNVKNIPTSESPSLSSVTSSVIVSDLTKMVAAALNKSVNEINPTTGFYDLGLDSKQLLGMVKEIEQRLECQLYPTLLFEYTNIQELATYFEQEYGNKWSKQITVTMDDSNTSDKTTAVTSANLQENKSQRLSTKRIDEDIAIIGLSGKYPQADDIFEFWQNTCEGKNCITEVTKDHWDVNKYFNAKPGVTDVTYGKWGGLVRDIDKFDSLFFHISPRDAKAMDPQLKLLLETAWHTVEDAGYTPESLSSHTTGVYIGVMNSDFDWLAAEYYTKTGQYRSNGTYAHDFANRLSYLLNFQGPSITVATACSSSLTAIHLARTAILNGECDIALAGGVNLSLHQSKYIMLSALQILSPDGKEKTFDAKANGYVPGEGVGTVLLKRLSQAKKDGDHIYGVIKASAINHSGTGSGKFVPNIKSLTRVVEKTLQDSGIDPEQISYIESHGTGTLLGDPIELKALANAIKGRTSRKRYCALGSKANIGHLEPVSGICSLTKVLMSMQFHSIPKCNNVDQKNPTFNWDNSPFYIPLETKEWLAVDNEPRIAGINSFGLGGSNAFMLVEEYISQNTYSNTNEPQLIILSAQSKDGIKKYAQTLLECLERVKTQNFKDTKDYTLENIAYTLQIGRKPCKYRLAIQVDNISDLHKALQNYLANMPNSYIVEGQEDPNQKRTITNEEFNNWISNKQFNTLINYWITGGQIDWALLHIGKPRVRVSLPGYPFARERHWISDLYSTIETPYIESSRLTIPTIKTKKFYAYHPILVKKEIEIGPRVKNDGASCVLILNITDNIATQLSTKHSNAEIISIKFTNQFTRLNKNSYEINANKLEDFNSLLIAIKKDYLTITDIIIQLGQNHKFFQSYDDVKLQIQSSYDQLFYLTKALLEQKQKTNIQLICLNINLPLFTEAVAGLIKTIHLEAPKLTTRLIDLTDLKDNDAEILISELMSTDTEVYYNKDKTRLIKGYQEIPFPPSIDQSHNLKKNGVYLITGGMGGLGLIFARFLAKYFQAQLILMGRSILSDAHKSILAELEALGATKVFYLQTDISNLDNLQSAYTNIRETFGKLNGIIHSAGVINDAFLVKKTREQSENVFIPKIYGSLNLDAITKDEQLDLFVMFSSNSSSFGNMGQCDYAYANGFMDHLAAYRNDLVKQGKRKGKTISLNWPLWASGGMKVDEMVERLMRDATGAIPIDNESGIDAFLAALADNYSQQVILFGDKNKLEKNINVIKHEKQQESEQEIDETHLANKVSETIAKIFSETLMLDINDINPEENLSDYGIDSISITAFVNKICEYYTIELTPTVLFEHSTLESFISYLLKNEKSKLLLRYGDIPKELKTESSHQTLPPSSLINKASAPAITSIAADNQDIAIIGMSGRFPQSPDLEQFWENLINQKDLISEVPSTRWQVKENIPLANWGGFIDGIDEFDAKFFKISPAEAELMDPQQRIFLETVWKTIENSGYTPKALAKIKTGLFVGVSTSDYNILLQENLDDVSPYISTGNSHSVLANRVSYLLNLTGPSEAIDTACSSSLFAIHHAVKAIQDGDCEIAIAGGVNAMLSPTLYVAFTKAGMLCEDGRCKTFDKSANGYVRGEGVGAILLKPLNKALKDRDHIYGVIKGTAINHGGHVSSLTVPNPNAQADVIISACQRAQIDPRTISYIETHGTGTALGDPIEINGLKKAFASLTEGALTKDRENYCGLGTVKTNVGHLEAAAGIVSVIKVLLAMQHGQLPGIVNFKELNPYIDIKSSPFYIVKQSKKWERLIDNEQKEVPRRAGISSFGFGGANAHIIVEEAPKMDKFPHSSKPYYLMTISGKTETALKQRVSDLKEWINKHASDISIEDLSFTLNTGKTHFDNRCAFIVSSLNEFKEVLEKIINNDVNENIFIQLGTKKDSKDQAIFKELFKILMKEIADPNLLPMQEYRDKLQALANFYTKGYELNWEILHRNESKQKIDLPSYPFAKTRYWITSNKKPRSIAESHVNLHPLLDENISTMKVSQFTKIFTGDEFYLSDHRVLNERILPGVAYLEMARAAATLAMPDQKIIALNNIIWMIPIKVSDQKVASKITLHSKGDSILFEITSQKNNEQLLHAQGKIFYSKNTHAAKLDKLNIAEIKSRCLESVTPDFIYDQYKEIGLQYGPSFQVIKNMMTNSKEVLSELVLPDQLKNSFDAFILHPSLMDGALQSLAGLMQSRQENLEKTIYLPFSIGQIDIFASLPENVYTYIKIIDEQNIILPKYEIYICDKVGNVSVIIRDFVVKPVKKSPIAKNKIKKEILTKTLHATPPDKNTLAMKVQNDLLNLVSKVLKIDAREIKVGDDLTEYGADSIAMIGLLNTINSHYKIELNPSVFLEHTDLHSFADYLVTNYKSQMLETTDVALTEKMNTQYALESVVTTAVQSNSPQERRGENLSYEEKNNEPNFSFTKKAVDYLDINHLSDTYQNTYLNYPDLQFSLINTSKNVQLEVVTAGRGKPILFLTPIDCLSTIWRYQFLEFAKEYKVISIHYPGCGRSSFNPELIELNKLGDLIIEVINLMNIKTQLNLVGMSTGGIISEYIASTYPDGIESLTLVNSAAIYQTNGPQGNLKTLEILQEDFNYFTEKYFAKSLLTQQQISGLYSKEAQAYMYKKIFNFDATSMLSAIHVPTLIIAGAKDKLLTEDYSRFLADHIKNSKLYILHTAGHYIPVFNSVYFNHKLKKFISKL